MVKALPRKTYWSVEPDLGVDPDPEAIFGPPLRGDTVSTLFTDQGMAVKFFWANRTAMHWDVPGFPKGPTMVTMRLVRYDVVARVYSVVEEPLAPLVEKSEDEA